MAKNAIEDMEAEIAELERGEAAATEPEPPAPDPESQPEPEAPEQPETAEQREPSTPGERVNLARALEEERRARKELQKEVEEDRRERAILADRLERLQQVQQQPPPAPDPQPELADHIKKGKPTVTFDEDPGEYMRQRDEIYDHDMTLIRQDYKARQDQGQRVEQHNQLLGLIQGHEAQFVQQHPDYYDAVKHLRQDRYAELTAIGFPPNEAARRVHADEMQVAITALQARKDPADVAYALAKRRGYSGPAPTPDPTPANGNGTAATTPAPTPPPMDRLAAGSREAVTLGAVGGGTGAGKLTPDALLKMSEEDFAAHVGKLTKAQQREMFGA